MVGVRVKVGVRVRVGGGSEDEGRDKGVDEGEDDARDKGGGDARHPPHSQLIVLL